MRRPSACSVRSSTLCCLSPPTTSPKSSRTPACSDRKEGSTMLTTKRKIRFSPFDAILYLFMLIIVALILFPMIHMIAVSFSTDTYVMKGQVGLWPLGFTTETYGYVFDDERIFRSYGNTIFY